MESEHECSPNHQILKELNLVWTGKAENYVQKMDIKEWEEHRIDHWPFRSWCPHCVKGRGRATAHRSKGDKEEEEYGEEEEPDVNAYTN